MIKGKLLKCLNTLLSFFNARLIRDDKFIKKSLKNKNYNNESNKQSKWKFNLAYCYLISGTDGIDLLSNSINSLRVVDKNTPIYVFSLNIDSNLVLSNITHDCIFVKEIPNDVTLNSKNDYKLIGTHGFNHITMFKFVAIQELIKMDYKIVVYLDIDTFVLQKFDNYVMSVLKDFSIAVQSESSNEYPPTLCTGIMFIRNTSQQLLEDLVEIMYSTNFKHNDQTLVNKLYYQNVTLRSELFVLPESLFQNGLHWKHHLNNQNITEPTIQRLKPYVFHSNFIVGNDAKRKLLKRIKMWY
jgi:hypothetical protein